MAYCCMRHFTCRSYSFYQKQRIVPIQMAYNVFEENVTQNVPLIVMHGLFASKTSWNSLSKTLNRLTGRKVITVDARNHGDSPHSDEFTYYHLASDINHLLKNLNIPKACILGHSMGGRAAMLCAHIYPETVHKLIVLDVSHKSPGEKMTGMSRYLEAMRTVRISPDYTLAEGRQKANLLLAETIPDIRTRQFILTNLVKGASGFQWKLNVEALELAFSSHIVQFPHIETVFNNPTLFIGGTKSTYLREEHHEELLKMFPKAQFTYLDADHWVHVEKPEEFLALTKMFLNHSNSDIDLIS